jgi:diguanylate cyclase (GGDEF)-like protein
MQPSVSASTASTAGTSRPWWRSMLRSGLQDRAFTGSEPVRLGRGLLIVTGVVVVAALPLLHPTRSDLTVMLVISAAMSALLVGSLFLPWHRWSDKPTIVFPLGAMVALACVGYFTDRQIGGCFTGLFVLCFAYVGICERQHTAFAILPVALPTYVLSIRALDTTVAIRLIVTAAVWILLAELLAHLIRQRQLVADMMEAASRTDELTRLANRRDLDTHLRHGRVGDTLVMCDLDHFKALNDSLGHAAGDAVLRDFGSVLLGCLRGDDYAARYGGEEFVLILSETDARQAVDVLLRLRRRWAQVHPEITFSAGYASNTGVATARELLEAADRAMYAAKSGGRDCYRGAEQQPAI